MYGRSLLLIMYILTCQHCGKDCGYYLDAANVKLFCSKECLLAFGFKRQSHSDLEELNDIGYFHSKASSFDSFTEGQHNAVYNKDESDTSNEEHGLFLSVLDSVTLTSVKDRYKIDLTQKQFDVLKLIAAGKSNKEIAQCLYVEERTIEHHVHNLLKKIGLKNRTLLAIFYKTNEDNIYVKKQPPNIEGACQIKQPLANSAYKKIEALHSQGVTSYQVVAHIVGCSQSYAKVIINKLNREKAENYFSKRLRSGMNENLNQPATGMVADNANTFAS